METGGPRGKNAFLAGNGIGNVDVHSTSGVVSLPKKSIRGS